MNREEETLAMLKQAHEAPINEAHYAAMRARVLSQIETQRRPWRRWLWASVVAAVAVWAALNVGVTPKRAPVVAHAPIQAKVGTPAVVTLAERPVHVARVRRHRTQSAVIVGPPAIQPLMVKLITSDPNVVIYWFTGE